MDKLIGKLEWVQYLERRQPLFVLALFARAETVLFKRITGSPTQHQLNLHKRGKIFWLRNPKELEAATQYFSLLFKNNDKRLSKWAKLWVYYDKKTDELIKKFSAKGYHFNLKEYKKIIKLCENIFIYSTIIPHRLLTSLDPADTRLNNKNKPEYLKQFEALRSQRKYPQVAEKVFKKLWLTAAQLQNTKGFKLFSNATPLELEKLFYFNQKVNLKSLRKRAGWALFKLSSVKGDFNFSYNRALESRISGFTVNAKGVREVKGITACPGKVRAKARIVHENSNLNLFKKGEIVVAASTSPSLMPILIKCSAIVTDEGGMGSHAAIISRELGKPCVIGTNMATRIFRTGDLLEVDANNAIVRKM